jgi:hypothetical protein
MKTSDLLPHLPPPPASILMIIGRNCDFKTEDLAASGYEINLTAVGNFWGENDNSHGDFDVACEVEKSFDPDVERLSVGYYDIVVLSDLSDAQPFLCRHLKGVRSLLKPAGALLFYTAAPKISLYQREIGISKEVLTTLYEHGFRIKFPPKNNRQEEMPKLFMVVARKDRVFLRTYRVGDERDILPMFKAVFRTDRTMAHWKWKFQNNPFGNHKIALAVTEENAIAAHFCGYAVPFFSSVGGPREILSLQGADTMTHPRFRQMGLGSTSVLTRAATYFFNKFCVDDMPFMYGYNTGHIKKFGERFLGYRYMSPIPYHVLNIDEHKRSKPGFLARMGRYLSPSTLEPVSHMVAEFDHLFNRACEDYGLLVKKDAAYLQWRYLDCPDGKHRLFAVNVRGRLVGWSVFSLRDDVLVWGDALFEKKSARYVAPMIDDILKNHFPDVKRIEGWFSREPEWWSETLEDAGFEVTKDPQELAAGIIFFDETFTLSFVDRHLYYTMGDSDLF